MDIDQTAAVIQRVIDIGSAVVECREEEAQLRRTQHMTGRSTAEIMLVCDVTQGGFSVLDRTDAAEDVIEDFTGALLKDFVVAALERYIVGIGGQQDDIAVLAEIQRFNDALIERIAQPRVAQMGAAQPLQQAVFVTVFDLCDAECNV